MTDAPKSRRPEKKSETIEVRVSYSEKLAFMEACRRAGTTASHAIRGYIDGVIHPAPGQRWRAALKAAPAFLLIGAGMTAIAYWQLTPDQPPTMADRIIRHFDRNGDAMLSAEDAASGDTVADSTVTWLISSFDQDGDGRIGTAEIAGIADMTIELRGLHGQGTAASNGERVLILPPGLSAAERRAYLEQSGIDQAISAEDHMRLQRIIDALGAGADQPAEPD